MVNGRSSMYDRLKSVRQWSPRWCHDEINISHRHCSGPALSGSVSYGPLFWSCDNIEKKNCLGFLGFQGCLWVIYSENRLFFRGKELSHPWYVHLSQNASLFAIFIKYKYIWYTDVQQKQTCQVFLLLACCILCPSNNGPHKI